MLISSMAEARKRNRKAKGRARHANWQRRLGEASPRENCRPNSPQLGLCSREREISSGAICWAIQKLASETAQHTLESRIAHSLSTFTAILEAEVSFTNAVESKSFQGNLRMDGELNHLFLKHILPFKQCI